MSFLRLKLPPPKKILSIVLIIFILIVLCLKVRNKNDFKRFTRNQLYGGDELKYLRMVHSLATDGNLELSNLQGFEEDTKNKDKSPLLDSQKSVDLYLTGKNGGIYCLHLPGVSFLILPAYLLDSRFFPNNPERAPTSLPYLPNKLHFTRLLLILTAILIIFLLFRFLCNLFNSLFLGVFLILLYILNSPFPSYIFKIYPDFLAALFCLFVLNAIFYPFKSRIVNDILIILGIGYLPWFHQRFIMLSLGLYFAYIFYRRTGKINLKKIFILSIILFILSSPYFYYFYSITGNPSPLSTSKLYGQVHARWNTFPMGFFGHFLHPRSGCIWIFPWTILFFFGIYWGFKKDWKLTTALLLIFIPYYLICSAAIPWGGGNLPPHRFLLVIYPLFLAFSAITIQDLFQKFSYPKLIFYLAYFFIIFLNKKFWFIKFYFNQSLMTPADFIYIIKSMIIIFFLYISIFLGETFLFSKGDRNITDII